MSGALGFKMSNYDFQVNIMNDTEPSADQTAAFEKSLTTHTAKMLFYNSQVTDPTTDRIKKIAQKVGRAHRRRDRDPADRAEKLRRLDAARIGCGGRLRLGCAIRRD